MTATRTARVGRAGRQRTPRTFLLRALTGIVLVVGASTLVVLTPAIWARSMAAERMSDVAEAPARDVGIVFGAEMYASGEPSPYLKARLDLAADLYAAGRVKVLVVSGDNAGEHNFESTNMLRYLVAQGVPEAAVVEDQHGYDTYDTCVRARQEFGVTQAILVTQTYHLPRAIATCRAVGVDAVGVGDDSVRATSNRWFEFSAREYGANLKMVWDLASRRQPVLEGPSDAVTRALRA